LVWDIRSNPPAQGDTGSKQITPFDPAPVHAVDDGLLKLMLLQTTYGRST
jgi:hypothetical protein